MHVDLPMPLLILLSATGAIALAALGAVCAAPLANRRVLELKRDLQAWRFVVDEYRCWLGPEMPDIDRLLENLTADADGAPLNADTPSFSDNCTINGLREQLRRIRTGLSLRIDRDDDSGLCAAFWRAGKAQPPSEQSVTAPMNAMFRDAIAHGVGAYIEIDGRQIHIPAEVLRGEQPAAATPMDAEAWAELHTLRAERGPADGSYATWKDAAVAERKRRVELERAAAATVPADEREAFVAWLAREMPAGTVIGDPAWWAPRILRAALAAPAAPMECERCGLASEQHTGAHWCDNQSFTPASPAVQAAPQLDDDETSVWPIVNVTVDGQGKITEAKCYAPGLPAGNHDVYPVRVPYMDEHTQAWCAVFNTLLEVAPAAMNGPGNGIECAVRAIKHLAERSAPQAGGDARPVALKEHGAWDGLEALDDLPDGTELYATPRPVTRIVAYRLLDGDGAPESEWFDGSPADKSAPAGCHYELAYATPQPAAQAAPAVPLDVEALRRTAADFDDGVDAEVPYSTLMAWAAQGLVKCTRFVVTDKGRAALITQGASRGTP